MKKIYGCKGCHGIYYADDEPCCDKVIAYVPLSDYERLQAVNRELGKALKWISNVSAMDYEYQKIAKEALKKAQEKGNE